MGKKIGRGVIFGIVVALLIIVSQPFHPTKGLIPELVTFLTTVPLWIAAMLVPAGPTPLVQGAVVLVYFIALGILIGAAFERKGIWGWLLIVMLVCNHYTVYVKSSRQMGEVLQAILNHFH